jgi:hypothetical protein
MAQSEIITIIVAIISLLSSITVAIVSYILNKKKDKELKDIDLRYSENLKRLEKQLASEKSEEDALRDYKYEAKKRLYEEYEPLLFQLIELAQDAYGRIIGLARSNREGNLEPPNSWLGSPTGYYPINTIYRLIAPLSLFRLMQRRITLFDLALEPLFNIQYVLVKALYNSFSEDFTLAKEDPSIDYDPYHKTNDLSNIKANKFTLQSIYRGIVDNMADALLIEESHNSNNTFLRIMSFGEFQEKYFDREVNERFIKISNHLKNFTPYRLPVFWRILVTQACIYRAVAATYNDKDLNQFWKWLDEKEHTEFDWRTKDQKEIVSVITVEGHFKAAKEYIRKALGNSLLKDSTLVNQ